MGQLQHGAAAHSQTGRNALYHSVFTGADQGLCALFVAVILKIDAAHQALADAAVHLGALYIDKAGRLML